MDTDTEIIDKTKNSRIRRDTGFTLLPYIASFLVLLIDLILFHSLKRKLGLKILSTYKKIISYTILSSILIPLIIYFYKTLLFLIRKTLFEFYLSGFVFVIFLTVAIYSYYLPIMYSIIIGTSLLIVFLVQYFFMRNYMKISLFALEHSLEVMNKFQTFYQLPLILEVIRCLITFFFYFFGLVSIRILEDNHVCEGWEIGLFFPQSFCTLYVFQQIFALYFLYGASLYYNDFKGIEKERVEEEAILVSTKYSFGSTCFGALLMAIVKFLRMVVEDSNSNNNKNNTLISLILMVIGLCVLSIMEGIIEFLNSQAYVYAAIYGKGLIKSGKLALEQFRVHGVMKIINWSFTDWVLSVFTVLFGVLVGHIFGGLLSIFDDVFFGGAVNKGYRIFIIFSINASFLIAVYLVNNLIAGMANCQIALYYEDPDRFNRTYPYVDSFHKVMDRIEIRR